MNLDSRGFERRGFAIEDDKAIISLIKRKGLVSPVDIAHLKGKSGAPGSRWARSKIKHMIDRGIIRRVDQGLYALENKEE